MNGRYCIVLIMYLLTFESLNYVPSLYQLFVWSYDILNGSEGTMEMKNSWLH